MAGTAELGNLSPRSSSYVCLRALFAWLLQALEQYIPVRLAAINILPQVLQAFSRVFSVGRAW